MTTTNKTTVNGIDYIAQVTADVTLNGMDLLVLMTHVQNNAEASIAALRTANADEGEGVNREALDRAISKLADGADDLLVRLHGAYQAVLVALWTERRKDPRYARSVMPELTAPPKVER
jgi:hypothetical protein